MDRNFTGDIMQEFILPIRCGMTIEKAIERLPDIPYQATDKAIYFEMFKRYPKELIEQIRTVCPNCGNRKIVPVLFYSRENVKLVEEGKGILAPGAYDNPAFLMVTMGAWNVGIDGYIMFLAGTLAQNSGGNDHLVI
ncbi:hypothetical protein [Enterocloster asparagiformis]|uniref:hypothetical protein n=1 Tax=Enterocloster asparagiformis TaxID=333367 RepID=UPI0004652DB0|nr:hypothetical protein [Enterocloster asparagiformis]